MYDITEGLYGGQLFEIGSRRDRLVGNAPRWSVVVARFKISYRLAFQLFSP